MLHSLAQASFLVGTRIAVQDAPLHGLVDFAEGRIKAGVDQFLPGITGFIGVGSTGLKALFHQRTDTGAVDAVSEPVALGNLNALLGGGDVGHGIRRLVLVGH